MTYAATILPEFDQEMAKTRTVLERIPEDKLDWKAHPKSHTIGWNAIHLADLPNWLVLTITQRSLDLAPVGGKPFQLPSLTSKREILELFDHNVVAARNALSGATDEQMAEVWTLLRAGTPMMAMPRSAVVRGFVLNHGIHHRAHLCVYLRLNNIAVPGMYGPSGDE